MPTATRLISNFKLGPLGATASPIDNVTFQGYQYTSLVSVQTLFVSTTPVTFTLTGSVQGIFAFVDDQVNPQTITISYSGTTGPALSPVNYTVTAQFSATTPFSTFVGTSAPSTVILQSATTAGTSTTTVRVCTW